MKNEVSDKFSEKDQLILASKLANRCVQCGFCTATCPTFQITGNELDGPRGRISLIKGVLAGRKPTRITQKHLDRCLLCRNCETTCPSGVEYGNLFSIGKKIVEEQVERKIIDQIVRWALKKVLTSSFFSYSMTLTKKIRSFTPRFIRNKIPKDFGHIFKNHNFKNHNITRFNVNTNRVRKKVLFLSGCVQPAMLPNINASTFSVLSKCGIECLTVPTTTCCGAIKSHLNDKDGSILQVKQNIDSWWPFIKSKSIKSIVINASGCSLEVKKYHELFPESSSYYQKAKKISSITIDLSEILPELVDTIKQFLPQRKRKKLAFHPPCSLQHGQGITGLIEGVFKQLGFEISVPLKNQNICCGSAGTYSILQPKFATILKNNKLLELNKIGGEIIVSANIGCITHLQSGTNTPVMHWIEVLANELEIG